jgi:hypothetical protein
VRLIDKIAIGLVKDKVEVAIRVTMIEKKLQERKSCRPSTGAILLQRAVSGCFSSFRGAVTCCQARHFSLTLFFAFGDSEVMRSLILPFGSLPASIRVPWCVGTFGIGVVRGKLAFATLIWLAPGEHSGSLCSADRRRMSI